MRHSASAFATRPNAGRGAVLWALIVALLVYGYAGTLLQIVGPMHRHAVSQTTPTIAETLRRWHQQAQGLRVAKHQDSAAAWAFALERMEDSDPAHAREHALGTAHAHAHDHAGFERHHHDPADGSVIPLDAHGSARAALDGLAASAALGSATLPLFVSQAALALAAAPFGYHAPALRLGAPRWRNADVIQEDRPPRLA